MPDRRWMHALDGVVVTLVTLNAMLDRALLVVDRCRRPMIGICGPPAAGKSRLAQRLAERIPGSVVVGMDGFHFAQEQLCRAGSGDRKGAPDTFDAHGFLALLGRIAAGEEHVFAPRFHRDIEEPVANAVEVSADASLVIVEGNYLLLDEPPWSGVRELLHEIWYLDVPEQRRVQWLISRHQHYGRTEEQARTRAWGSDQRNAELIARTKCRADLVVSGD